MSNSLEQKYEWAAMHARRFLETDPGTREVYFLPVESPVMEVRLIAVNDPYPERETDPLEPLDLGVDVGDPDSYSLLVLDVSPQQWKRLVTGELDPPPGWVLEQAERIDRVTEPLSA